MLKRGYHDTNYIHVLESIHTNGAFNINTNNLYTQCGVADFVVPS